MKNKLIFTAICATIFSNFLVAQETRSTGRKYSKKLVEQEKYFDNLKKSNGESYGNKEIGIETNTAKIVTVEIQNNSRTLEIRPWDKPQVKINTVVYFDGKETTVDNTAWLSKLNIKTKLVGNTYKISTEALPSQQNNTNTNNNVESVEVYSVDGQYIKSEPAKKRAIIIYVPKDNKIKLNTRYSDVSVSSYLSNLEADITNGNFECDKISNIVMDSKYANVSINSTDKAEITFINGDLVVGEGNNLELDTKYSNVVLGNANNVKVNSTNDEYEVEQINSIEANKNYGSFKIEELKNNIQFVGTNAPIKIKKLHADVKNVDIDNKYTDIKLPLKEVKNFKFEYDGVYSNIQKNFITPNGENRITTTDSNNSTYKAHMGVANTNINIKCSNCNVDLR